MGDTRGRGALALDVTWLAVVAGALLVVAQALWFHHLVDDAFITFRYARNWVDGHGVVFNPGERVEGYTSLLWVVTSAASLLLGVSPLAAARVLGVAGAAACVVAAFVMARRLAPLLVGLHSGLGLWAWAGMETTFFAGLVALAFALHLEGRLTRPLEGVLWLAVCLTRPEGGLLFVVALVSALAARPGGLAARVRPLLVPLAIAAVGVLAHLIWRRAYYGAWLPNTFHAKTGATTAQLARGARYLGDFVLHSGGLLALLPALAWRADWRWRTLAAGAGAVALFAVLVGGDNMLAHRFLVPAVPLLAALAATALGDLLGSLRARVLAVAALALLLCRVGDRDLGRDVARWNASARDWIQIGHWLHSHEPPGTLIALGAVGAVPYYSRLPTIDLFGLTDAHIAARDVASIGSGFAGHEKGDGAYVLSRRPALILGRVRIYPMVPAEEPILGLMSETLGEREVRDDPRFARDYRFETARVGRGHIALFRRVSPAGDGR